MQRHLKMEMKRQSLYLVNHIYWVSSFLFIIYSLFQHYWTIRKNTISFYWLFYNWLKIHNFSVLPMLTSGCFLNSQKNWAEGTESPHTCTVPPHYQHPTPQQYICYKQGIYTDTSLSPKVHRQSTRYCMFYGRHVSIIIHVIQSMSTALKNICAPPFITYFPHPLATTDLFIISIVLLFPEGHIVRIIQYVAIFRLASFP